MWQGKLLALFVALRLAACCCGGSPERATAMFGLGADWHNAAQFFDLPFPNDLRLQAGALDVAGFPNRAGLRVISQLLGLAGSRQGVPQMPVAWFRFDDLSGSVALPAYAPETVMPASPASPIWLLDIDPASPEHGRLWPTVAARLSADAYVPGAMLAVAPQPGVVLRPKTQYAIVVRRQAAPGFAPARDFLALRDEASSDARLAAAQQLYAPLWPALATLGADADDILVATVFTTGDEPARLLAWSDALRARHLAELLPFAAENVVAREGYCQLTTTVRLPQFQVGVPPYDDASHGGLRLDAGGQPEAQGSLEVPLVLTLPFGEMPREGWPLYHFVHGSGGRSTAVVDMGPNLPGAAQPAAGRGPAWVVARHGVATVGAALPLNPERLAGASDYAYLNLNNLQAFPFTFAQGVFEQRMLLDAVLQIQILPELVAACPELRLPVAASAHHFRTDRVAVGGQSMGAMYTNLLSAVEPRYGAVIATGAGGHWPLMATKSAAIPGGALALTALLRVGPDQANFLHPAIALLGYAWELAEPMVYMNRLAERPLGSPRHVYQPVGLDDEYFAAPVLDAAAVAYGNAQAGASIWASLGEALAMVQRRPVAYPARANHAGNTTNVVVQFASDGLANGHYIYRQLEAVKHQYGCFLAAFFASGAAEVVAPAGLDAPCDATQ